MNAGRLASYSWRRNQPITLRDYASAAVLDLKLIRDNPEGFDAALKKRGLEPLSDAILKLDAERRNTVTTLQEAQSRRNQISKDNVGKAKAAKREDEAQKLMAEVAALKDAIPDRRGAREGDFGKARRVCLRVFRTCLLRACPWAARMRE